VGKTYNIIGESQTGNQLSSVIAMKAQISCGYENVSDEVCVAAFEALSIQPWIAAGNVEMIKFSREGGCEK
jgi:hypothetical protein